MLLLFASNPWGGTGSPAGSAEVLPLLDGPAGQLAPLEEAAPLELLEPVAPLEPFPDDDELVDDSALAIACASAVVTMLPCLPWICAAVAPR